jgi:predicted nucleic acid-binding protein
MARSAESGGEVRPSLATPTYVVDTSVALKWFVERGESDVEKAVALAQAYRRGECRLRVPGLLALEVANALIRGRRFTLSEVLRALIFLKDLELVVEDLHWPTLNAAVEISAVAGVAVYDCYFLAMALESDGHLVTADEMFIRKAHRFPKILPLRRLKFPLERLN